MEALFIIITVSEKTALTNKNLADRPTHLIIVLNEAGKLGYTEKVITSICFKD